MDEKVTSALRSFVRKMIPKQSYIATVQSVDENNFTCDVQPLDDSAVRYGVRLKPAIDNDESGIIAVPSEGSDVIVAIAQNDPSYAYVSVTGKVKYYLVKTTGGAVQKWKDDGTIEINGTAFGGLVIVQQLVNRMNAIENAFNTHVHPGVSTGGGVSAPVATQLTPTVNSDIESNKVKHGSG